MAMRALCVILGRAGSKGLAHKNALPLGGRPMVQWTVEQAMAARRRGAVERVVLSTDGEAIAAAGRAMGVEVIDRPDDLADDAAAVDAAARHAVRLAEAATRPGAGDDGPAGRFDAVVILYANVPLRPDDLIDRALAKLAATGCDSVQSVCPVGKAHPYWMKRLAGPDGDALVAYEPNAVYRRQDLPPAYMLDGGIIAVQRDALFVERAGEPHAFLGEDRRAIVTAPGEVVDVDDAADLAVAAALLGRSGATEAPAVVIAGRAIERGGAPYVIAELGVNHDGSLERAVELVDAAAAAGADAVKTQLFDPRRLLSAEAELAGYQRAAASDARAMLEALQLGAEAMLEVRDRARAAGLGFIVTPFSIESLGDLERLAPDAVKIASPDCVNAPLIEAMGRLDAPMLISTGAATVDEWLPIVGALRAGRPTVVMRCVSAYPTPTDHAALGGIGAMLSVGPWPVGYSDHTSSAMTGALAVAHGAAVVEKHLTYDTRATGPDHAASFDPPAFADYTAKVRQAAAAGLGADLGAIASIEADVRRVSRQSVCATADLPAGHVVRRGDLTCKRPGTAIPAARLDTVVGRRLARAVAADRLIRESDLETDD